MRLVGYLAFALFACGAPAEPAAPAPVVVDAGPIVDAEVEPPVEDAAPPPPPAMSDAPILPPVPAAEVTPISNTSFEEATAKPEHLDVNDDRGHLDDNQLNAPMRGVLGQCHIPPNAKVTIKAAVQNGRAIGVSVYVEMPRRRISKKKPTKALLKAAKAQASAVAKLKACADHATRILIWPSSSRRDAITTTF